MSRAKPIGVTMTDRESRRAGARDLRSRANGVWQETARLHPALGKDRRLCGVPLGDSRLTFEARKGVFNAAHAAISTCGDQFCPRCGFEIGTVRWACIVLTLYAWAKAGGYAVFVSVAPRHHERESVAAKVARIRLVSEWLPGDSNTWGRQWMAANGVEKFIRVTEPTLGGQHGVNVGAHYILLCTPLADEPPEVTAEMLGYRLQQVMGDWVAERIFKLDGTGHREQAEALADEWGHFLADRAFHSEWAGVSVANYVTKLAEGPGLAGAASELTDPTGTKRGARNVSMRAYTLAVAELMIEGRYRSPAATFAGNERAALLAGQFAEVRRAVGSKKLFNKSQDLFARWEKLPHDELIGRARAIMAEADPLASAEIEALFDSGDDEDDEEVEDEDDESDRLGYDAASQAFHQGEAEDGSVDHGDDDFFRTVELDAEVGRTWCFHHDVSAVMWSLDLHVARMLDELGAFGGVVALRDATRTETGEKLYLHAQGDVRPVDGDGKPIGPRPRLLVTNEDTVPGWDPLDWADAEAAARASPRRRRMTQIELSKARDG